MSREVWVIFSKKSHRVLIDKSLEIKLKNDLNQCNKLFFYQTRAKRVKKVTPRSTNSPWKVVKMVKDVNVSNLPKNIFEKNEEIPLPERFATLFNSKIKVISDDVTLNNDVYNGSYKLMKETNILRIRFQ